MHEQSLGKQVVFLWVQKLLASKAGVIIGRNSLDFLEDDTDRYLREYKKYP